MAGYSRIYVLGGEGGFRGADGVNPIVMEIRVGEGNRQWLEARYFETAIERLGDIQAIIPEGPGSADALIDACIAFHPEHFANCAALASVRTSVAGMTSLDFTDAKSIPSDWITLRDQARVYFDQLNIWVADLKPLSTGGATPSGARSSRGRH
jgi:hypothetical protein